MSIERGRPQLCTKPWGVADLTPWSKPAEDGGKIGEIWYELESDPEPEPSLRLKLLFADQPLSIQVHPDDECARSMGLAGGEERPGGKDEAWYVLDATPGARVGIGLTQSLTRLQLGTAIADGSIADLVLWRGVLPGESFFVPAGTIHALGAGLVVAEVQQRNDVTFRMFDHGRGRELHLEQAVTAAEPKPAPQWHTQCRLSDTRCLLATGPHFVFERLDLPPDSLWRLNATQETWLMTLTGSAAAGNLAIGTGDVVFARDERVRLRVGAEGLRCLAAYAKSEPLPDLVRHIHENGEDVSDDLAREQLRASFTHAMTAYTHHLPEHDL